jgi:hypothetical protein
MPDRLLTQGEIEQRIMAHAAELAEETERYSVVAENAATAEADYKQAYAIALVHVANETADRKTSAADREAHAQIATGDKLRVWKITDARLRASKESLTSIRTSMDALRTLSANVRAQT